jgi:hypothetical protein
MMLFLAETIRSARRDRTRPLPALRTFIGSLLVFAFSASGAELDSSLNRDLARPRQLTSDSFRSLSAARLPSSDESPFQARVALGFESNVFEVNGRFDNPVADGFVDSSLAVSVPLKQMGDDARFDFSGTSKIYFRESQIDEYLLKPDLVFGDIDLSGATLQLDAWFTLLRERIFNEFGRVPDRSEPGASGGFGWNLDSDLSKKTSFTWSGETEYQTFFSAPNDNIRVNSKGEFQTPLNADLDLNSGTEWEFQRYRVRPRDIEAQLNPRSLATLEGRGFVELDLHPGRNYVFEAGLNAGPNIDLTNGYYNAAVIGASAEIRRRIGKFKVIGSAEPELVWFTNRPTNLSKRGEKLFTQEYLFEFEVEYDWTKHIKFFCAEILHVQESSSDESKADAVLNSFIDNSVKGGVIISF